MRTLPSGKVDGGQEIYWEDEIKVFILSLFVVEAVDIGGTGNVLVNLLGHTGKHG